jgi:hypothetical protein
MTASIPGHERPRQRRLGRFAVTLAVAAACAGCATTETSLAAGGRFGRVDLVRKSDGSVLPMYAKDGRNWVVGTPGEEYAVRVCNSTGGRMLTVISVDGVNAITGATAAPAQSGYVLSPYECADIGGWRKSMAQTAAFYFTELPDAYATRTGRPENVGVVGVAFFPERQRPPVVWKDGARSAGEMRSEAPAVREQGAAQASAENAAKSSADATAKPSAPATRLGTGHGRMEDSPTQMVAFERASPHPAETIAIHYDRRENLIALGVLPPPYVAHRTPNPFPAWTPGFVPDPPR